MFIKITDRVGFENIKQAESDKGQQIIEPVVFRQKTEDHKHRNDLVPDDPPIIVYAKIVTGFVADVAPSNKSDQAQ